MGLARVVGLLYRTIIAPTAVAFVRSRDVRCSDAAGTLRPVQYLRPAEFPPDVFDAVYTRAMGAPRRRLRARDWFVIATVATSLVAVIYLAAMRSHMILAVGPSFMIVTLAAIVYFLVRSARRIEYTARAETVRDAWLAESHCPSCCYPLGQKHGESTLRCSECGSVWNPSGAIDRS
jgi:hypothetical protein